MSGSGLIIGAPDDFHVHFRQGRPLRAWALPTARVFSRALVMPNIVPPASTPALVISYKNEILSALRDDAPSFLPLMAFKLLPGMGPEEIHALADCGCLAGKYYPAGSTTNAEDGVPNPESVSAALSAMEERGITLSIHGEDPSAPVMERETAFLPVVRAIAVAYPRLKIVLEHLSTAAAVHWVMNTRDGIAATITAHHLAYTIEDMIGGAMNPHLFCKPVLKTAADRAALRDAAFSGDPRFFFGSDSAPHPTQKKESGSAPAGVYSAPVGMPLLASVFIDAGKEQALDSFCSRNGADFYGLPRNKGTITIAEEPWAVPEDVCGARPLLAGTTLRYSIGV